MEDGTFSAEGAGCPGVWTKDVVDGVVVATLAPPSGPLHALLRPAIAIQPDPRVDGIRHRNPCYRPGAEDVL